MIVAITGNDNVGKTTCAEIFARFMNCDVVNFADELKCLTSVLFNIPISVFNDREMKDKVIINGFTPRDILKKTAVHIQSIMGQDYFVKCVESKIQNSVVFGDCRFTWEEEFVKNHGGVIVRIVNVNKNDNVVQLKNDFTIYNNMTDIECLNRQISCILDILNQRNVSQHQESVEN